MKILIVDDESNTRRGLIKYVNWNMLGITAIEEAVDAFEAQDKVKVFRPDIILSDVRMPGMSGIDLCQKLREEGLELQFIFLSGFSDKEYLKAAIELSAVSYVEKPIDLIELEQVLKKAVSKCRETSIRKEQDEKVTHILSENSYFVKSRMMSMLINRHTGSAEPDISAIDVSTVFTKKDANYLVMVYKTKKSEKSWQNPANGILQALEALFYPMEQLAVYKDDYHVVHILALDNMKRSYAEEYVQRRIEEEIIGKGIFKDEVFCGIGECVKGIDKVPDTYQKAVIALQAVFYYGYNHEMIYRSPEHKEFIVNRELQEQFLDSLAKTDREAAAKVITAVFYFYKNQDFALSSHIKNVYYELIYAVVNAIENLKDLLQAETCMMEGYLWKEISEYETISELNECLKANVKIYFGYFDEKNVMTNTIITVVNLIRQNYGNEDLSVKWLAQKVYLTPTYLSFLFKKEVGKTIGYFIKEVRVEKSKELLRDKKMKLYHIAKEVGYSEADYFTKVFKQMTGVKPSDFRENMV